VDFIDELRKQLLDAGWILVRSEKHQVWRGPNGKLATLPQTPKTAGRAAGNLRRRVARAIAGDTSLGMRAAERRKRAERDTAPGEKEKARPSRDYKTERAARHAELPQVTVSPPKAAASPLKAAGREPPAGDKREANLARNTLKRQKELRRLAALAVLPCAACWQPRPFADMYAIWPVGGTREEVENWRRQFRLPQGPVHQAGTEWVCAPILWCRDCRPAVALKTTGANGEPAWPPALLRTSPEHYRAWETALGWEQAPANSPFAKRPVPGAGLRGRPLGPSGPGRDPW
jgi:hypothetical protein